MLKEVTTYLRSDAVAGARKAGLVKESVAIVARYKRHGKAWHPHIERCKAHISMAVKTADPAKPILVIGAGPCLDVPLEMLNAHPSGAILLDAVRLPLITKILRECPNLTFQLGDVTGLLKDVDNPTGALLKAPITVHGYGLIISLNILSQLPIPFANMPPKCDEDSTIIAAIQKAHVKTLQESGVPIMVISDYKAKITYPDSNYQYTTLDSSVFHNEPDDVWTWEMAPEGELALGKEVRLEMGMWLIADNQPYVGEL